MVKKARISGTLELLPPGPKFDPKSQRLRDRIIAGEMEAAFAAKYGMPVSESVRLYTDADVATEKTTATNVSGLAKVVAMPSKRQRRKGSGRPVMVGNVFRTHLRRWDRKIRWEGEVKAKEVKGADVGNRLYAGKRRMFKGHKWERVRGKRLEMQARMMRFMSKRIARYKGVRAFSVLLFIPQLLCSLRIFE